MLKKLYLMRETKIIQGIFAKSKTTINGNGLRFVWIYTMIYPWENEQDLFDTTEMVEQVAQNPVNGVDEKGRTMKYHVDSTIMTPYQGTQFFDMINLWELPGVKMIPEINPGSLYYKGNNAGSGWPYLKTRLPREQCEEAQAYRNSLRPEYR